MSIFSSTNCTRIHSTPAVHNVIVVSEDLASHDSLLVRERLVYRYRVIIRNVLYLLLAISFGLTITYQVLLPERQLKVRNLVAFFLPTFTVLSDPRIACLREASAPILFIAWLALSEEWYTAMADISTSDSGDSVFVALYAERVGCAPGELACTVLRWYMHSILGTSICYLVELVIIISIQHGDQIWSAPRSFSARYLRRCTAIATTPTTSDGHNTAPAANDHQPSATPFQGFFAPCPTVEFALPSLGDLSPFDMSDEILISYIDGGADYASSLSPQTPTTTASSTVFEIDPRRFDASLASDFFTPPLMGHIVPDTLFADQPRSAFSVAVATEGGDDYYHRQ